MRGSTEESPDLSPHTDAVSVVIPYYNSSTVIQDALASVRAQTRRPAEILVVDDGSSPDEAAKLDEIAHDCVVLHLPENRGPSVARNAAIGLASGRWIAFLDADDWWEPTKLEAQLDYIAQHPDCRAIHCSMRSVGGDGPSKVWDKTAVEFDDLVDFPTPVFPSALMVERTLLFECGLFDPNLRVCQDLDLTLRITQVAPIHVVAQPLVNRRLRSQSVSRDIRLFWNDANEVYRRFAEHFPDREDVRRTLVELNATFFRKAFHSRDTDLWRSMVPRLLRRDITAWRLGRAILRGYLRDKLSR